MTGRVLVVRPDGLGDVVLLGPAIRAIAARAPVTLLCGPSGAEIARRLPGVDDVLVESLPWIDADPEPVRREQIELLVDVLSRHRFAEAIIFTSFHQSPLPTALVARLAGIPRVGAISEDYPGALLDVRHHVPDDLHEVERSLSLAAAMGYPLPTGDDARLRVTDAPVRGRGPVVVHPGASVAARTWAPTRWSALVRAVVESGRRVVVTGGESEAELASAVAAAGGPSARVAVTRDLSALLAALAAADAVVVGNTGPAHLAAALGTPVVSLFPPTVPAARWRPWRVPHVLLGEQSIPCAGCRARMCPIPGQPCLAPITPALVLAAIDRLAPRPSTVTATAGRRPTTVGAVP
jgi:ADP-heptose:LPS heptosyltransferase